VGQTLAFREMVLGPDYTPRISQYKVCVARLTFIAMLVICKRGAARPGLQEGVVTGWDAGRGWVTIALAAHCIGPGPGAGPEEEEGRSTRFDMPEEHDEEHYEQPSQTEACGPTAVSAPGRRHELRTECRLHVANADGVRAGPAD
jgi:hypothetical protein